MYVCGVRVQRCGRAALLGKSGSAQRSSRTRPAWSRRAGRAPHIGNGRSETEIKGSCRVASGLLRGCAVGWLPGVETLHSNRCLRSVAIPHGPRFHAQQVRVCVCVCVRADMQCPRRYVVPGARLPFSQGCSRVLRDHFSSSLPNVLSYNVGTPDPTQVRSARVVASRASEVQLASNCRLG